MNSVVDSFRDNRLCLKLSAELKDIVTSPIEQEIKSAIDVKLGISCRLELIPEAGLTDETPHQARIRQQEEHRQTAISIIKESEVVKKLNRAFGAELVETSVRKLED